MNLNSSSFFSSLLTQTSSKYNNLRRQLISSEADGDTEDDSHISRVLRAYYTEKGRPFPDWLPPDPKAPAPIQMVSSNPALQQQAPQYAQQQPAQPPARWGSGRAGGLSDLWDSPKPVPTPPAQPSVPASLRPGGLRAQAAQGGSEGGLSARLLPSQRAGSYQSQTSVSSRFSEDPSPPTSSGTGSNKDRLKARLWGAGRTTSPTPSQASVGSAAGGGFEGGGRFAPPARQGGTPVGGAQWGGGQEYGSGGGYAGRAGAQGGYDAGQQGGVRPTSGRMGLPSGPKPMR
ncbi:hypothetical protein EJ06DRAFT_539654 [Trichodelitschia bisporula]|uniref:Mso1 N-terminal domain-containing protein n=1 Tax=Trichodelitschia bisporula TaxID=703511 RepID=A0A6G1HNF3_9PEZI|nr:hypothetical protein EJ06DRAFT_539654 [Trichodelitschia bisporula]